MQRKDDVTTTIRQIRCAQLKMQYLKFFKHPSIEKNSSRKYNFPSLPFGNKIRQIRGLSLLNSFSEVFSKNCCLLKQDKPCGWQQYINVSNLTTHTQWAFKGEYGYGYFEAYFFKSNSSHFKVVKIKKITK